MGFCLPAASAASFPTFPFPFFFLSLPCDSSVMFYVLCGCMCFPGRAERQSPGPCLDIAARCCCLSMTESPLHRLHLPLCCGLCLCCFKLSNFVPQCCCDGGLSMAVGMSPRAVAVEARLFVRQRMWAAEHIMYRIQHYVPNTTAETRCVERVTRWVCICSSTALRRNFTPPPPPPPLTPRAVHL
jgi:hypothetical protein